MTVSSRWIEKRRPDWNRLETLLAQCKQRGLRSLRRDELRDLGLLYRQVAADLARLREDPAGGRYASALNRLLGEAHNLVYAAPPKRGLDLWRFYRDRYPRIFRAHLGCVALAVACLAAGALAGAWTTRHVPGFDQQVLGPQMIATIRRHQMWTHSIVAIKPLASSGIMTNNLTVALSSFALGITAGAGTLYLMLFNGLMLGVVGAACAGAGMSLPLWSFVAGHGALELPAIAIAGGAGFRLARGLLFPGDLPRREALAEAGSEGGQLLLGVIPLLVVAGVIEAFISPTDIAPPFKFLLGGALFCLLLVYLFRGFGDAAGANALDPVTLGPAAWPRDID